MAPGPVAAVAALPPPHVCRVECVLGSLLLRPLTLAEVRRRYEQGHVAQRVRTDADETHALLTGELLLRLLVMGLLPAVLVWRVKLPQLRWSQRLRRHAFAIVAIFVVSMAACLSSTGSYAVYFREHKPIRSLGGSGRKTNPRLAATLGVVYLRDATSCATSTALSVPCVFSHLPRSKFDVDEAPRYANLPTHCSQHRSTLNGA
jgi:glucan phosphoethanolaminetransferase (alkaline phosphatase superfamily)